MCNNDVLQILYPRANSPVMEWTTKKKNHFENHLLNLGTYSD